MIVMLSLFILSFQLTVVIRGSLQLKTLTQPDKWKDVPRQFETVAFESFR
jgi:hypothetical protein